MSDYEDEYTDEWFGSLPALPWVIYREDTDEIYEIPVWPLPVFDRTKLDSWISPDYVLHQIDLEVEALRSLEIDINGEKARLREVQKRIDQVLDACAVIAGLPIF